MPMKAVSSPHLRHGSGVARADVPWQRSVVRQLTLTNAVLHNNAHPCVDQTALLLLALPIWGGHLVSGGTSARGGAQSVEMSEV